LADNSQSVDNPSLSDNHQPLADESLETHPHGVDKDHVHDHIEALPSTHQNLNEGPVPPSVATHASPAQHEKDGRGTASTSNLGSNASKPKENLEATSLAAAKLEQARKMGEFHGRVEAIRKSVSGINHLLDELEVQKPPGKRPN
jgi:hypothetical protein